MIPYLRKKKLKHILYHIVLIIGILAIFISVGPLLIIGHFGKPGGVALMFSGMWAMISFLPALLILVVGIIISLNGILKSLFSGIHTVLSIGIATLILSKGPILFLEHKSIFNLESPDSTIVRILESLELEHLLFFPSILIIILGVVLTIVKSKKRNDIISSKG